MSPSATLWQTESLWRDRAVSFTIAVCCHVAVFVVGGAVLVKPPEYGLEPNSGGIEVNLVAALPQAAAEVFQTERPSVALPAREDHNAVVVQSVEPLLPQQSNASSVTGDGSSPVPGKEAATLYRRGGTWTNAKPSHFRNPVPNYPEVARREGQEGLVVLVVRVDKTGHPTSVVIKQSSKFPLLDEAATSAVTRWRFAPARAGGLPMESTVEVPIRFRLEDEREK